MRTTLGLPEDSRLATGGARPTFGTDATARWTHWRTVPLRLFAVALAIASTTIVRQWLGVWLGNDAPLLPYLLPIIGMTLLWGFTYGCLATILGALAGTYFFLPSAHNFAVETEMHGAHILLFLVAGSVASATIGFLRRERDRTMQSKFALDLAQRSGNLASFDYDVRRNVYTYGGAFEVVFGEPLVPGIDDAWWTKRVSKEDSEQLATKIAEAASSGSGFEAIFRFTPKAGTTRWIAIAGGAYCDEHGNPIRVLGVNADITKQKTYEAELAQAKETAEAANAAKSVFLASMSHEIRTPLAVMVGFSEILGYENLSEEDRQKYTKLIQRNGQLLSELVDDVLDLSKIEAGRLEVEQVDVNLGEVLADVSGTLRLKAKGLDLVFAVDDGVPQWISTDATRLRQILINIVGNAIKFTPSGSVRIDVRSAAYANRAKLSFDVSDTGLGISEAQAARLFEPFAQAEASTRRHFGGTGLGLVIAKKLAICLGGDVTLTRSAIGKGSTFTVTIDVGLCERRPDALAATAPTASRADKEMPPLNGTRILLAEDSADVREMLGQIIDQAGGSVDGVTNGREAVEFANRERYDLILMDIQMPVMNGYEAVELMRLSGLRCPIVAISALTIQNEQQKCLEHGFNEYLRKPVPKDVLVARLASLIRTARV